MIDLDLKDRKILYQLDINARQSDNQIAKKVGLSREVVYYRINNLIKKGIIRNFLAILNHNALGYLSFRVFFRLSNLTYEREKKVAAYLKDKVAWLVRVSGNWDFNTMIFSKSFLEFEQFLNEFKEEFSHSLVDYDVSFITRIYHYRRGYILDRKEDNSNYDTMGEVTKKIKLDELDHKIISLIENNARMSYIDMARKLKTSERVVRYKLKRMVENRIILGFRSLLDLNKFGLSYFKVHFKLQDYKKQDTQSIKTYCHLNPNIVYKTETIGGPDLEIEIQVPSNKELYTIINEIRDKFKNIINSYETLEYTKEYHLTYGAVV